MSHALAQRVTASGLARQAQVPVYVIRYYTRIGLLRPARDPDNGYQLYAEAHLRRLRFILRAKALGYTLREIRAILEDAERGRSPCPRVRRIIEQRIVDNRRRLAALLDLQQRMEHALAAWERMPDGIPDGHTVCHLIESLGSSGPGAAQAAKDNLVARLPKSRLRSSG